VKGSEATVATGQPGRRIKEMDLQMASMCHWSALAGLVACGLATPLGPLLIWLAKKDQGPFVDYHGKEALNFQLNIWVVAGVLGLLGFIHHYVLLVPGLVLLYGCVLAVKAGSRAGAGEMYRYPYCLRVFS